MSSLVSVLPAIRKTGRVWE